MTTMNSIVSDNPAFSTLHLIVTPATTSFNVYRDGGVIASGLGETSYTDAPVTGGVTYCYTVTQSAADGSESGHSNEACATPEIGNQAPTVSDISVQTDQDTPVAITLAAEDDGLPEPSTSVPDFTFTANVSGAGNAYDLTVGFSPDATDGFDDGVDVYAPPAPPPPAPADGCTYRSTAERSIETGIRVLRATPRRQHRHLTTTRPAACSTSLHPTARTYFPDQSALFVYPGLRNLEVP